MAQQLPEQILVDTSLRQEHERFANEAVIERDRATVVEVLRQRDLVLAAQQREVREQWLRDQRVAGISPASPA
jgi:hypothetical protein